MSDCRLIHDRSRLVGVRSLDAHAVRCAVSGIMGRLAAKQIARGDRVACIGPDTEEYVLSLLALWHLGAVACPLNRRQPARVLMEQCRRVGARLILADESMDLRSAEMPCPAARFAENRTVVPTGKPSLPPVGLDEDATVVFTWGSSGHAKAAVHTIGNHWFNARGSAAHFPVEPGDTWLLSLPLFHVGGLAILFRTLPSGGSLAVAPAGTALPGAVRQCGATHVSVVQAQLAQLVDAAECGERFAGLKVVLAGGSTISASLTARAVRAGLPLYLTYGSTEMCSQVATSERVVDCGCEPVLRVLPFREVAILPRGEIGVRGRTLFRGYLAGQGVELPLSRDGWFATGDRGALDHEGLRVAGRLDRMVISGGENIQPEQLERLISSHPLVEASVVVAVNHGRFGQRPVAFVKPRGDRAPSRDALVAYLRPKVASFAIPDRFYLMPLVGEGSLKTDYRALEGLARGPGEGLEELADSR